MAREDEVHDVLGRLAAGAALREAAPEAAADPGAAALRAFPGVAHARWRAACAMLADAGLGEGVVLAYARHTPALAERLGVEQTLALAERVKELAYAATRQAAQALPAAAARAADRLGAPSEHAAWVALILRFAREMPESMVALLGRTDHILAHVGLERFEVWAIGGLRAAAGDRERRLAFFSFADPQAERALLRESGEVVYADLDRRLRAYLTALWGIRVVAREAGAVVGRPPPRRISFDGAILHVPVTFPGMPAHQAADLFRAGIAHVGAHLAHSGARMQRGRLRAMQVAIASLIEDARVERLAMRRFPGLRDLWLPYHTADPGVGSTPPALMARLSRALIDPDYADDDCWVQKGRTLFEARRSELEDPAISRGIGNLLGNDLGQMRVQFNARTYVVEPPYRDDNTGLWDFPDAPEDAQEVTEILESFRIAPERRDEDTARDDREPESDDDSANRARPAGTSPREQGVPVACYPEWDYLVGRSRDAWVTVVEYPCAPGPASRIAEILERRHDMVRRITALVRSARVSRPQRVRGRQEGEQLDIDACIRSVISRRHGNTPDPRVYMTAERKARDLSILVLLDVSRSTMDPARGARRTVLELEREATALLAHAMREVGDPFALAAFCSDGREEVRYLRIKDFDSPYDRMAEAALAGLTGDLSTRMGAAMRHAAADLRGRPTHRKLLLVVTDGEPSDIDVEDRRYLVEDARKAVGDLRRQGIDVFCVGLDSGGDSYLNRIFGRRNAVQIDRVEQLPEKLPMLYFRLTA